jgi:Ca-activated chloride channel family protein
MTFIWPAMLVFLLLIPGLVGMYLRMVSQRKQRLARFGGLGFVQTGTAGGRRPVSGARETIPPLLFLAGLSLLLLAMARPQMEVSLPRMGSTVLLTFDVSGSMAAEDFEPTRMEAAKEVARNFVEKQPSNVLIGVVSFSDSGFTVQAATDDREAILASINRLEPERGTSLANGILAALNTLTTKDEQILADEPERLSDLPLVPTPLPTPMPVGTYSNASIVLFTDGENNVNPDPLAVALISAERGVRIYTVGIGSVAGTTVEIEGFNIHTQLNEALLNEISAITGGVYYHAENEQDLEEIYKALDPKLEIKSQKMEITSLMAGASLVILLAGAVFSLFWFQRLP